MRHPAVPKISPVAQAALLRVIESTLPGADITLPLSRAACLP